MGLSFSGTSRVRNVKGTFLGSQTPASSMSVSPSLELSMEMEALALKQHLEHTGGAHVQ